MPRKTKGIKAEKKANYGGGGGESAGTAIAGATHGPGPQAPYLQRILQNSFRLKGIELEHQNKCPGPEGSIFFTKIFAKKMKKLT